MDRLRPVILCSILGFLVGCVESPLSYSEWDKQRVEKLSDIGTSPQEDAEPSEPTDSGAAPADTGAEASDSGIFDTGVIDMDASRMIDSESPNGDDAAEPLDSGMTNTSSDAGSMDAMSTMMIDAGTSTASMDAG